MFVNVCKNSEHCLGTVLDMLLDCFGHVVVMDCFLKSLNEPCVVGFNGIMFNLLVHVLEMD